MTTNGPIQPWEADPLAVRLSRIPDPRVSDDLLASVLSRTQVRSRRAMRRWTAGIMAIACLAALIVLLAATPAGAFVGRAVLPAGLQQRFGLVAGAPEKLSRPGPNDCAIFPGSPNTTSTTTVKNGINVTQSTRTCSDGRTITSYLFQMPDVDLQRAQRLITFPIRTPAWLPNGLQPARVGLIPKAPDFTTYEDQVAVIYRPAGAPNGAKNLTIHEQPGSPVGGSAVPSSAPRAVWVNGQPAVYARGSYESTPGGSATWTPNADVEELSWQLDGVTFEMTASGLGLSQSDLVRIAESIQ